MYAASDVSFSADVVVHAISTYYYTTGGVGTWEAGEYPGLLNFFPDPLTNADDPVEGATPVRAVVPRPHPPFALCMCVCVSVCVSVCVCVDG